MIRLPYYFYLTALCFIFLTGIFFFITKPDNFVFNISNYSNAIFFTFFQAIIATFFSSFLGFIFSLILYLSGKNQRLISAFLNFFRFFQKRSKSAKLVSGGTGGA